MFSEDLVFTIQKRGPQYYVVRTGAFLGSKTFGPFASYALALADAEAQEDAGPDRVARFPV